MLKSGFTLLWGQVYWVPVILHFRFTNKHQQRIHREIPISFLLGPEIPPLNSSVGWEVNLNHIKSWEADRLEKCPKVQLRNFLLVGRWGTFDYSVTPGPCFWDYDSEFWIKSLIWVLTFVMTLISTGDWTGPGAWL